jgi:hypothetical protein
MLREDYSLSSPLSSPSSPPLWQRRFASLGAEEMSKRFGVGPCRGDGVVLGKRGEEVSDFEREAKGSEDEGRLSITE